VQNDTAVPRLHAVAGASKALAISGATLRRRIKDGTIRAVRIGSRVLISDAEIERLTREGTRPANGSEVAA
jgi:excisionase family DNA binding protein